jgi:hypothetical protein
MSARKLWLPEEIEYLKNSYPDIPMNQMVLFLNRTSSKISNKAHSLGIKRSESFYNSEFSGRIKKGEVIGKGTQFSKGVAGWNKGKKQSEYMKPEEIEKTKATRFQKGIVPHNIKPIGYERITRDGYVEVKVRESKTNSKNKNFELKHRLVWQQQNGEIPEGMNVEFVAGADRLNFTIDDLVLRTRSENMKKNFESDDAIVKRFLGINDPEMVDKIKNQHPELIELKRQTLKLNNQLNRYERETN